jgi:predicted phage tail component-like protein
VSMGFTFNNVHSNEMGVVFKSVDRTLLPPKRVTRYTIPGKSGTYDIEDGYENREIVCEVAFVGDDYKYQGVRTRARAVAEWLSGEGLLVFDDEPGKAYNAKVVSGVSIEQIAVTGRCEVAFSCAPFAESLEYNQQAVASVSLPRTERVDVSGSQETDCLIYITARGRMTNLTVTRLKVN